MRPFANVPELMIALFAVAEGLFEVVRGSLSGSVVANLLLVLGVLLAAGGSGDLDRSSARLSLIALALSAGAAAVAAARTSRRVRRARRTRTLSFVWRARCAASMGWSCGARFAKRAGRFGSRRGPTWSLTRSLVVLGLAMIATAVVAETITGSISRFAEHLHVSEFFAAAVLVALAGNAADHGAAVVVAVRGQLELAADVALESAAQVAVFVVPAVALAAGLGAACRAAPAAWCWWRRTASSSWRSC